MPTTTPFNNLITFSRGSNATVTGSNGLIQWAPNNLLTFSEQFDNAVWNRTAVNVTPNSAVAPDGTTTADLIAADNSSSTHTVAQIGSTTGATTISIYAKAGGYNYLRANVFGGTPAVVSLTDGVVVQSGSFTVNVTALPNGWYRCSFTHSLTVSGSAIASFGPSDNVTGAAFTGNGTSGVLIWGAQLELGSTATTYNPTTVKNLLGFSEAFDNAAWTKVAASIVTGAQANPVNGLFNAQKLMENTANAQHYIQQSFTTISGTLYTISIIAKAAGRDFIVLSAGGSFATNEVYFNLATGTVSSISGVVVGSSISGLGSGWYRCSITVAATSSGIGIVYPKIAATNGANTYTGDGNSGVYIYGAQLSDSASLDPYVPTPGAAPSSTAFYGPRFDFDPVTLQPRGLLVEEQRTNLFTRSEEFDNAAWTTFQATVTANQGVAPDGTTTADNVTPTNAASNSQGVYRQNISVANATSYTYTVYAKANGYGGLQMICHGLTAPTWAATFNLTTGQIVGKGASVTSQSITAVGNGWYRCSATVTSNSTLADIRLYVGPAANMNADGSITPFAANGSNVLIWGAQLEAGAFATSYIPTVASTVTRSADVATITGQNFAQWYGQTEGSFVASVGLLASFNFPVPFMAADSAAATTKRIQIYLSGTAPTYRVTDGTDQAAINTAAVAIPGTSNFAAAYQANNFAATVNGAAVATDSSGTVPAVNTFYIGNQASTQFINGHIRNIRFIPARAADFQLQALST